LVWANREKLNSAAGSTNASLGQLTADKLARIPPGSGASDLQSNLPTLQHPGNFVFAGEMA